MLLHLHNRPLCIDERMIGVDGTGVATYATALQGLLPLLTDRPMLLGADGPPRSQTGRVFAAARPGERPAHAGRPGPTGEERIAARDLFREAHVHFTLYGRLLRVRPPFPGGVMHWTYPVPLHMAGWINVYTVHDAIPLTHSALTPIRQRRHRRLLGRIARAADRIVTVSDAARHEILAAMEWPAAFVENVSQTVPAVPLPDPPQAGLRRRGYLLICGTIEPRKNVARLVDAYRMSAVDLPLVVAGPDGWRAGPIVESIETTPNVRRLPRQSRAQIDALIANARALLMPSLAEGFGLPVIEAMAQGTPVLTADAGALAETAGGAALLVDPHDTAAIAAAIRRLARDEALCATLAEAGRRRAAAFARPVIAERLGRLYGDLIASRSASAYPLAPCAAGETS